MHITPCRVLVAGLAGVLGAVAVGCASLDQGQAGAGTGVVRGSTPIADPGFLRQYAETYRFGAGRPTAIRATPDGDAVLFLRSGPRSNVRDLYSFDPATGAERVLLTAADLLGGGEEALSAEEKARRERMRLSARGIARYTLSKDGRRILVPLSGDLYVVERATGTTQRLTSDAGYPIDPRFSPDGSRLGVVRDRDLYVQDIATGAETRLTRRDSDAVSYGVSEFVAQEEMGRFHGFWWSPDGEKIAVQRTDESGVEVLRIMDPTRPENPPHEWRYPRPGKANAEVTLGIMPATGGEMVWVQWDRGRYPYLATVKWSEHGPLTILVQNRTQTEEVLLAVDDETGYTTPLLVEEDPAWINLDQDMPRWLPGGRGFLWTTERRGAWQLEHRAPDGSLIRVLTPTDFGYRGLVHVDEATGDVIVQASAEPTETHLWRVPMDATRGGPRPLTSEPGSHGAVYAERGGLHVHTYETSDGRRGWDVVGASGRRLGSLTSVAEAPPFEVNIEWARVGGARRYDASIIRPRDFRPGASYPVIVSVYGGPHAKTVTRTPGRSLLNQWFADHGFIVVQFDGRGTPNRGRAWERAIKNDVITGPLADQVEALRATAQRVPEMDLSRVGIYGWSFGGYFSAHAVMQRPDVYRAGVAGAPVADWLDYDTHYTERYMGLPEANPEGYERASVLTHAPNLERPLLVIHGTADDNVYFMHSLKMADAMFRGGREFEFVPLPGFTHMVPDPLVTERLYTRIIGFFEKTLRD
ncbi:MAG: S9 family peptidase [Planctomycetota bacterium]|nr:MAG: S9 family peptidase [Planctomycetota bacterium]